ncbi:tol-pal system protein YbgF [Desulfarculus baarsii]|nr:tol-pal system protein YbgF [Desulfarculus baarsii]
MKKTLMMAAVVALAAMLTTGCAVTQERFDALQGVVNSNQAQLRKLSQKVDQMSTQMDSQRQPQAEVVADLTVMRQELARLSGQVDEASHMGGGAAEQMSQSLQHIEQRLAKVEKYLGISAPPPPAPATEGGLTGGDEAVAATVPTVEEKTGPSSAAPAKLSDKERYNLALRLYEQKSFDAARDRFEELLKDKPDGAYAASAQFWVGECYYSQKRFEEAILAYNQVIKRYAKNAKAPAAMLKQGLAFSALGDKRTAKIVLNKLVNTYPKSSQAGLAKKYLAKMD